MALQPETSRRLPLHLTAFSLLLHLLVSLLHLGTNPVCGYLRRSFQSPQIPTCCPPLPLSGSFTLSRPSSSHCSSISNNVGGSGGGSGTGSSEAPECLQCVVLRTSEESPPVVAWWSRALRCVSASRPSEGLSKGDPEKPATAAAAQAPTTTLDVVPLEVKISPETQQALGLPRGSQKKHIFLPLSLLGAPAFPVGNGGPFGKTGEEAPRDAGHLQGTQPPVEKTSQPTLGLLDAITKAACKALKWAEVSPRGPLTQLVAHVAAPKTKGLQTSPLASKIASRLTSQTASSEERDRDSAWEPFMAVLPLTSEQETLRVLRGFYEPLLTEYHSEPHFAACSSSSGGSSWSRNAKFHPEWLSALRILRLPRGPRLFLQLQLAPSMSLPVFDKSFLHAPPPPPLQATEAVSDGLSKGDTGTCCPPYQMVSLYKFFRVGAPETLVELLRALWGPRGVLGRAYVASEGINAQLAVPSVVLPSLLQELKQIPGLEGGPHVTRDCSVPFDEYWGAPPFDALHVRARHQVLRDGFKEPLNWDDCGEEVDPDVWHRKLKELLRQQQQQPQQQQQQHRQQKRKLVLLDMRNSSEYAVGHFKGAERIDTPTFADSFTSGGPLEAALLRAGIQLKRREDAVSPSTSNSSSNNSSSHSNSSSNNSTDSSSGTDKEDVEVMMYCTGGIRCVKAGAFVKQILGLPKVTRLKGGIVAYKNFIAKLHSSAEGTAQEGRSTSHSHAAAGVQRGDHPSPFLAPVATPALPATNEEKGASATYLASEPPAAEAPEADKTARSESTGESLFIGSNYVFDHRMCQEITEDMLERCTVCGGPTRRVCNCSRRRCGIRVALCLSCFSSLGSYCSTVCAEKGSLEEDKRVHAQKQRRLHAIHTHTKFVQQRGFWAMRAQQLLAALQQNAAASTAEAEVLPKASVKGRQVRKEDADGAPPFPRESCRQDLWQWTHDVAAAASSPSQQQETLLQRAQQMAEDLTGLKAANSQFWSALSLAEGLAVDKQHPADAPPRLITIEKDPRAAAAARSLFVASPWKSFIELVEADATDVLRSLATSAAACSPHPAPSKGMLHNIALPNGGFDLIYLDAEKNKYRSYVATILNHRAPLLAPEGVLLIDNTLWRKGLTGGSRIRSEEGLFEEESARTRRWAKVAEAMKSLRETLRNDPRLSHVLLPVGDGLSLVTWAQRSRMQCNS